MRKLEGQEKYEFLGSLLSESPLLKAYIISRMQGCSKKTISQAAKEFPWVLADMMMDDWAIYEEN